MVRSGILDLALDSSVGKSRRLLAFDLPNRRDIDLTLCLQRSTNDRDRRGEFSPQTFSGITQGLRQLRLR